MRLAVKPKSPPDYFFLTLVFVLVVFGLVMLTSASSDLAVEKFNDSYFYLKHQIIYGLSLGVVGFLFSAFFYYRRWKKLAVALLIFNILLLILVFTPLGFNTKGATRWIDIGGATIQPGELLKMIFIIYLSAWLSKTRRRKKTFTSGLLPFWILVAIVGGLLILQPATTTSVIIGAVSLIVYFMSGAKLKFILATILGGMLILAMLIFAAPYRFKRFNTFLHPEENKLSDAYHINQALIAIGSGGLTGVGYGKSTTKLNYLPEPIGDSIFAVIAEELGFIGSASLISVFTLLIWRGLRIAKKIPDQFAKLVVIGFTATIGIQAFINIASISNLIPLTGVPLPFISYGGTSLAVFMTMSGIIINISRYRTS